MRTGARPRRRAGSLTQERPGPILDLRARWRVGQILLALAGLLAPEQIPALVPMVLADPSLETNPKACSAAEIERVLRKSIAGDLIP